MKQNYTYYHNPRCSKSRQGLELLSKKKINFEIKEYLKVQLSLKEIRELLGKLKLNPEQII